MKPRRTTLPLRTSTVAVVMAAALAASACSGPADETADDTASDPAASTTPTTPATTPTTAPSTAATPEAPTSSATSEAPAGPTLAVTIAGDEVSPNADEIDLAVGEKLVISFETDRGGELHVHSKPEQYVEFAAGTTKKTIVVETPGEVEIEEHDTGAVVAVLEVS